MAKELVALLFVCSGSLAGCVGDIDARAPSDPLAPSRPSPAGAAGRASDDPPGPGAPPQLEPRAYGPTDVRRLSREELRQTILDLLGVDVHDKLDLLPVDPVSTPFDNNARDQVPSAALLEGTSAVADAAAERVLGDATLKRRLFGCTPAGPGDETCLRQLVTRFGRRAFRRPLVAEEIDRYVSAAKAIAAQAGAFEPAAGLVVRAMLQDISFLYRIEIGRPVDAQPGLVQLTPFETATRLSYLLWGSTPSEALLDAAASGALATPSAVREVAAGMLRDPRALSRWQRAHAMWLDYETIEASDALARAMRDESDALVARVWAGERPWTYLFTAQETFVDATLANHYGLPAPTTSKGWVPYGSHPRAGLLGHGSVLTNGQKFGRTSIVQRGQYVLQRLACSQVPPPPPSLGVNVDDPPKAGVCKAQAVQEHAARPACAGCHRTLDGIGKGLESYDLLGRERVKDESNCTIDPRGELMIADQSYGGFAGPAELAAKLLDSGRLDSCYVAQMFQFANGRPELDADAPTIDNLVARFRGDKHDLVGLLLAYVAQPAFLHRVVEN